MLKMKLPGQKRAHTFYPVERNGKTLYVDWTDLSKKRGIDSGYLYRLENDVLVFDHYERVSLLRAEQ